MSAAPDKIAFLRAALAKPGRAEIRVPLGHPGADACLNAGLKRGALHEIFVPASHEVVATGFAAALAGSTTLEQALQSSQQAVERTMRRAGYLK